MLTQCPDCQTTFRVSTRVLQQAQGRVRCGGCGNAFNALEHLSEDDSPGAEENVPAAEQAGPSAGQSSADRNRELLETLDKLAGPDVRIEDTGVEWRVLDDELPETDDDEPPETGSESGATSSLRFMLEGSFDEDEPEQPALHGRRSDQSPAVSDAQVSLDLVETEPVPPPADRGERRYDDNTILPEDFGHDNDLNELPFFVKPETPKRRASDRLAAQDTSAFEEVQVDLALGEPDDWVELLDEVGDEEQSAADDGEAPAASVVDVAMQVPSDEEASPTDTVEPEADDQEPEDIVDEFPDEDMPSDIDTQFLVQAEEMGLDTGSHEIVVLADATGDDSGKMEGGIVAGQQGMEADELADTDIREILPGEDGAEPEEDDIGAPLALEVDEAEAERGSTDAFKAKVAVAEKTLAGDDEYAGRDGDDEPDEAVELELEAELPAPDTDDEKKPVSPKDAIAAAMIGGKDISHLFDEDSGMVETIIMEGESVHDALQPERRRPVEVLREFENPGPLQDTYSLTREKIRGGRRAGDPPSYTVTASVVVLGLVLMGQIVHQSRESLARYSAFNQTIGPIYRVLGKPVTPEWDIRGWQFEATNGSVDETEQLLTIYSRIANKSDQSLPYPLVHVSLTDRFEETIGSRVLEPKDYLAGDLDPRKPVPSGENFTAVITIDSPSAEATGFKLNVCYRVAPRRVRCATQDFKN